MARELAGGMAKSKRYLVIIAFAVLGSAALLASPACARTGGPIVDPLPDAIAARQFVGCYVDDTTVTNVMEA